MAKKNRGSCGNAIMSLPWIVRVILVIFFDGFVFGISRFIDGLIQHNIVKIILGFLWIFYGLGIGWLLDIIFILIGRRPLFF